MKMVLFGKQYNLSQKMSIQKVPFVDIPQPAHIGRSILPSNQAAIDARLLSIKGNSILPFAQAKRHNATLYSSLFFLLANPIYCSFKLYPYPSHFAPPLV